MRPPSEGNAISRARTPIYDRWLAEYPWTLLEASGEAVGLPAGVMGNSEVGHLTLGAGRMVPQDLLRIDLALRDGSFFENPALVAAAAARAAQGRDAAPHGPRLRRRRPLARAPPRRACSSSRAQAGVPRVRVHVFTDGRDTPPRSALALPRARSRRALARSGGKIATVSGRYYAMDRDKRWDRVARAYQALVFSSGLHAASAAEADRGRLRARRDRRVHPADGDHRERRARRPDPRRRRGRLLQLPRRPRAADHARADRAGLRGLPAARSRRSSTSSASPSTRRSSACPSPFRRRPSTHILADVWAERGVANLRLAETEKYAHVTYFFNGGVERPIPGEERVLVPSWKGATYDLHPRDERRADHRGGGPGARATDASAPRRQLRQRRHGRPHRQAPRDDRRDRDARPLLRHPRGRVRARPGVLL